ncbi:hypothetical protein EI94DRAFT_1773693 [Lactarius quietus]|nr:hypothetical protein EI94DRAFT_1773693 [Lactarius quietus]
MNHELTNTDTQHLSNESGRVFNQPQQGMDKNVYTPFARQLDWEVARWAKLRGPSLTSLTELMSIDGVKITVSDEVCELHFHNILQCIHVLFWDPDLAPHLVFKPERHYTDEKKTERLYHNMYVGSWWWWMQVRVEKVLPGAMLVPCAYPIYMMIGNIPKKICQKTSMYAYLLLGYLPTTKLELENNKAKRKWLSLNLNNGVFMSTATSNVHCVHPIFTKQVLITCMLNGDCPTCGTTRDNLGDFDPDNVPAPHSLDDTLVVLDLFDMDPAGFLQACSHIHARPLPYSNIFCSITPNGVIKHLKFWILSAWISSLSKVTGHKHDQICRFLLGIIINIRLPYHLSNARFLHSACALLDFLYLAQYHIHSHSTLQLLMDALSCFHANWDIFISLNICSQFTFLKLHYLSHYIESIKYLGTTDNFNMQFMEWLHIDLAKDIYVAMNHKDEDLYGAPPFKVALRQFVSSANDCNQTCHQLECSLWRAHLPFVRLPVWHGHMKQQTPSIYHINQICIVFSIPRKYHNHLFNPTVAVPPHMAYVEWYSQLTKLEPNHGMYKIHPQKDLDGNRICSIVPVGNIWQSVHLLPKFGPVTPAKWTSSNVLDCCDVFYLNTFSDQHMFHTTTC